MSAPESTVPEEFNDIFRQGVLVVGGHAVNLWASYYAHRGDRQLAAYAPFVSKDADIHLRDKEMAMGVAAAAGWSFRDNPEVRSPVLGQIVMVRSGKELTVDVLRTVTGLSEDDLTATEEIQFKDGSRYSVPAPEIMLKAKVANLLFHDQRDRQDVRHASIMITCCRHYLIDTFEAAVSGRIGERDAVDRFMSARNVVSSEQAQQADKRFQLDVASAIPPAEGFSNLTGLTRLQAFYLHQVHRTGPRTSI